jgi:hypothetical protein
VCFDTCGPLVANTELPFTESGVPSILVFLALIVSLISFSYPNKGIDMSDPESILPE